jgi:hypothetical protein
LANNYFQYKSGLGSVGAYQASSRPFLSSSINVIASGTPVVKVSFPTVTKFVTVKNTTDTTGSVVRLRVAFSENGLSDGGTNYFVLENEETYSADWRVAALYLRVESGANNATASVMAGETGIDALELPHNWSGSTGVG